MLTREDVGLRERTLWRMLYETAARSAEVLGLDVENLDLANRRALVRRKGGAIDVVVWQTGTARLLPRLLKGRKSGPVYSSPHRVSRPGRPQIMTTRTCGPLVSDRSRVPQRATPTFNEVITCIWHGMTVAYTERMLGRHSRQPGSAELAGGFIRVSELTVRSVDCKGELGVRGTYFPEDIYDLT